MLAIPFAAVVTATLLLRRALPAGWPLWVHVTVLLGAGVAVALLTERLSRRLLPLAVLLRMTMLFPDRAPSRIAVLRGATSTRQLTERLRDPDRDAATTARLMLSLVTALGDHDKRTRGHSERTRMLADLLGEELRLPQADRDRLRWAALLHDIGKLDVAPYLLTKPGALTDGEWERMRQHPVAGARIAAPLLDWLGPWGPGIEHHHERWDGSGYPHGLAGEDISLAGRLVSVVDAFETMTAARTYKQPMSTRTARAELARSAGTHFDPHVVRAFLGISLPRLLWSMGPLSLLVHLPYWHSLQTAGTQLAAGVSSSATAAGTAAAVGVGVATGTVAVAGPVAPAPPAVVSEVGPGRSPAEEPAPGPSGDEAGGPLRPTGPAAGPTVGPTSAPPTAPTSAPPTAPTSAPPTAPTSAPTSGPPSPSPTAQPTPQPTARPTGQPPGSQPPDRGPGPAGPTARPPAPPGPSSGPSGRDSTPQGPPAAGGGGTPAGAGSGGAPSGAGGGGAPSGAGGGGAPANATGDGPGITDARPGS
ncbi:hypothetical protein GCM10027194_25230 [Thalassiella azotivora]